MYPDDATLLLAAKSTEELTIDSYIAQNVAYQYCHLNGQVVNLNKKQLAYIYMVEGDMRLKLCQKFSLNYIPNV